MNTLKNTLKGKKHIGIYFQSWCSKWVNDNVSHELININEPFNVCYICFVHPLCNYVAKSYSFHETGLDFSSDFKTIKNTIKIMREKNIVVMLSVGGSDYSFHKFNSINIANLCVDLGCDGIDIYTSEIMKKDSDINLCNIVHNIRKNLRYKFISISIFQLSDTERYIDVLKNNGFQLDWVNINGSTENVTELFGVCDFYKNYFKGLITLGFKISTILDVNILKNLKYTDIDLCKNGIVICSYKNEDNVIYIEIIETINSLYI